MKPSIMELNLTLKINDLSTKIEKYKLTIEKASKDSFYTYDYLIKTLYNETMNEIQIIHNKLKTNQQSISDSTTDRFNSMLTDLKLSAVSLLSNYNTISKNYIIADISDHFSQKFNNITLQFDNIKRQHEAISDRLSMISSKYNTLNFKIDELGQNIRSDVDKIDFVSIKNEITNIKKTIDIIDSKVKYLKPLKK
jgi:hypothetical protein